MRVSAQNQIDVSARGASENDWVVRQQQFHFSFAGTCQRQGQILESDHCVVDSRQPKRLIVDVEAQAFVDQDTNAFSAKEISD